MADDGDASQVGHSDFLIVACSTAQQPRIIRAASYGYVDTACRER